MVTKRLNKKVLDITNMADKINLLRKLLEDEELRQILKNLMFSDNNQLNNDIFNNDRRAFNPKVGGSNPPGPAYLLRLLKMRIIRYKDVFVLKGVFNAKEGRYLEY